MIGKSTAAFITIVIWLGVSNAWSMQNEVRGVVTDAETSESLPGVNIRVKGTTTGGSTNINGEFSVGVSSLSDTLLFTFIGRSEEHTSELQSRGHLVCRLLLEKKKQDT